MEPIAEPPAPPARRPQAAPAAADRRRKRPGGAGRTLRALVVVLLLAALAVGAFLLITQGSQKQVQLKEDIQGGVEQSVEQLEDLIRENTR
jgi:uncharacterized protein HemX